MPSEFLETTVDKFVFKIKQGLYYSEAGIWIEVEGDVAKIGLTDYIQQSIGDIAFVEPYPIGTEVAVGDPVMDIETIKVTMELPSPVSGELIELNEELDLAPELVNEDPYGEGWLARIALDDWEADRQHLLDAESYLDIMREQALEEAKKL